MYHETIRAGRPRRPMTTLTALLTAGFLLAARPVRAAGFAALEIEADARMAARGESALADVSGLSSFRGNPAGLAELQNDELGLVYLDHVLDIRYLAAGWATPRFGDWTLGARVESLNWGGLDGYDAAGNPTGEFDAVDTRLGVAAARGWEGVGGGRLQAGIGAGLLLSSIEAYDASVLGLDLGLQWKRGGLALGAAVRNAGTVLSDYAEADTEVPMRRELGIAYRLAHLPFTWSLAWSKPQGDDAFVKVGGEFLIARRWHLGFGYHGARGDDRLSGVDGEGLRGVSAGIGGEIPGGFRFHWAWSSYGELGSLNRFSLGYSF